MSRATGEIHWRSEDLDEDLPEHLDDEALYARVPGSRDLDLGPRLVFQFAREQLPDAYEQVRGYFNRSGAYAKWSALLDQRGLRDGWHAFRDEAREGALREWAEENGFGVV